MKKILITSLTLILLFLICICLPVYAAENTASEATVTFDADPQTASRGATVTVTVVLSESDLAKSMMIEPVYDTSVLELQSGEWLLTGATLADNWTAEFGDAAIAYSAETDMNGEIFKLTFKVLDNASFGKTSIDCNVTIKNGQLVIANTTIPIEISVSCTTHSGGIKTCTSQAICDICHTAYGELLSHNYDNGIWKSDASGHWRKCRDCVAEDIEHKTVHHYDNSCDTTCNDGCGYIRTVSHNYEELKKNTTEHWYACEICGEEQPNSRNAHSGGSVTCQARAICETCGESYGTIGNHSYDMSAWGYKGADGHAHKCIYCDAHTTLEEHVPNADAATEQEAKYCTLCGYVIEQQLNHVHSEGTVWEYDSEYHWHDCVANDGQVYGKDEHTYDNACDTTCNVCNATRTITHDYTELKKDANQHWYVCSVCESEKANSRVSHSGGTATCQAKAECITCGTAYGELGGHDYDTTKWLSVDDNKHAHKCKLCDAYTEETDHFSEDDASCTEDKRCDACSHKMADAHGHSYEKQIESPAYLKAEGADCQSHHTYYYACVHCDASSKGDTDTTFEGTAVGAHKMSAAWTTEYAEDTNSGRHYHKCTVDGCDYKEDEGDCHGGERTCIALSICQTCQKAYGKYAEHTFGTNCEYKDATGHAHACQMKGCNAHDEIKAHTPNIPAATEESAQYCTACQYQMAAQLSHTHSPASVWTYNDTHHWHECTGCDGQELEKAAHNDSDNNGSCDACGHTMSVTPPPHNHAFGTNWETDANNHWKECECDEKSELGAHVDSDNNGKCDTCDYTMSVMHPHTHAHGSTWETNENEHWNECECGDKANKAAHNDDNGDNECDTCNYVMPAHDPDNPGTAPVKPGTDPADPGTDKSEDDGGGLGTGAIIGIVVASVAVSGGGGFALCWFVVRKKRMI